MRRAAVAPPDEARYNRARCAAIRRTVSSGMIGMIQLYASGLQHLQGRSRLKVLVSGGAGFIGSHLCARLLREEHQVLCVDNLLTGSERNIEALRQHPQFTYLKHDVTLPLDAEVDAIFHLASPASP